MYKFKIGDEVEVVRKDANQYGQRHIVTCTDKCGDEEGFVNARDGGWFPSSLKLVCPAGYRQLRADEMDEYPQKGDAFLSDGVLVVTGTPYSTTFRSYIAKDREPWFRPLTRVETQAAVVQEDRNWVAWYTDTDEAGAETEYYADNLTEQEARTHAEKEAKCGHTAFVARVHGKFVPLVAKWVPNE